MLERYEAVVSRLKNGYESATVRYVTNDDKLKGKSGNLVEALFYRNAGLDVVNIIDTDLETPWQQAMHGATA